MRKFLLFLMPLLFSVCVANAQYNSFENSAALQLVNTNKTAIGLTAEDLNNVVVSSTYTDNSSGIRMVYLNQTYKDIPVLNQMLVLAFKDGKLVSNAGGFNRNIEKFANVKSGIPAISAESAVQSALSDRGMHATQMAIALNRKDNGRQVEFTDMGVSREHITAQLIWMPAEKNNEVYLAWQVKIVPKVNDDYWMIAVNAVDNSIAGMDNYTDYDNWGDPLKANQGINYPAFLFGNATLNKPTSNLFDFKQVTGDPNIITTATYRVIPFPAEAPSFPNGAHALRTDPWLAAPGNATTLKWHTGTGGTDYAYSRGNNVWAYEDRTAPTNTGSVAKSASSTTPLPNLTFDFTPDYTQPPTQTTPVPNQQFNITNLFYWNNVIHDVMYVYGFTEVTGNFQADNLGRGGLGNDPVLGEAQDIGGTNNANFATPADGGSGRMQMYLWTTATPQKDGDVDNGVITHEFGHGISNRFTGGPANSGCLGNAEQMGEGWSDYYGLMFTQNWATSNTNTGFTSPRGIGTYVLNQPPTGLGIRSQRYCTDFTVNNKVYLATLPTSAHDRGEIWCATLWDMTWNIINQVGTINPNLYDLAGGGGNTIAMKLVTEGLRLQQCAPGFISGRNAILQADQLLYGGAYNCAIWEAFRRRGMGAFASEGSTSSVTDQVPDFTAPISLSAIVSAATIPEGQNLLYTNSITTCSAVSGYTLRDTLPTNVTYVSGGTYDAATRVVSFPVNQGAGTTNYPFTVNVNPGSYFPPIVLLNEPIAVAGIPAGWAATIGVGTSNWVSSTAQSQSAPNSLFAIDNPNEVTDFRVSTTSSLALGAIPMELTFWHNYNTEATWDGGVVEISTNGGTTWLDLGPYMTINGYNAILDPNPLGTNPIKGRPAFTGNSGGWIKTTVDLATYVNQNVMLRFRMTSDDNTADVGWYVDDIMVSARALVKMRSSLFNASNVRVSYRDMVTEITPVIACAPTITQQPVDVAACAGTSVTFTCVGTATGGVTYQWQISTTGPGGPWTNLANGAPYSGVTTSTLTINPAAVGMNNYQYRCVLTGGCAPDAISTPAILTVAAASVGGSVTPANSNVCGTTNSGTLTLSGHTGSVIRWEFSTVGAGGPFTTIANTTTTHSYSNLTQTTWFRAVVQFANCTAANSATAVVTFTPATPLSIVAVPGTTLCAGDPALLTVMEGNFSNATPSTPMGGTNSNKVIAFNVRNNNAFPMTFTSIASNSSATGAITARVFYKNVPIAGSPGAISAANGWIQFGTGNFNVTVNILNQLMTGLTLVIPANTTYGIVLEFVGTPSPRYSNGTGTVATYSNGGCDIITDGNVGWGGPATPGTPTNNPRNFNGTVTLVGGSLTPVTTGTFLWTPAAGLSSTTTNPTAASPMVTTTYTVNHDNGAGCVRQANITITVNDRPTVTSQPTNLTICNTGSASFTVGGIGTGLTYQWQVSTAGPGGPWVNLANTAPYSGVNTATLTVNPATVALSGYAYRCVLSGTCAPGIPAQNISNAAVLTVNALPTVSVTPTSGCGGVAGINGLLLTASGASTYTWAPVAGLYTNATATTPYTGGNAATVYAAPTAYTAYTVTGTNSTTGCSSTAEAKVNYTPPAPTVTPTSVTMCLGDPAVKLKSSSSQSFTTSFTSGPINVNIPDGPTIPPVPTSYPAVTSNITVSGIPAGATIANVRARFNITHAYVSDLVIALKAPNGQVINLCALANFANPAGANFTNTTISSAGTAPIAPPYTGTYRADLAGATFTAFGFTFPGGPTGYVPTSTAWNSLYSTPNGVWSIGLYDAGAPDGGVFNNWSLDIDYVVGVPATPAVWTPAAGLFSDAAALTPYVAGTAVDSVWTRPTPSGVYNYQATVKSLDLSGTIPLPAHVTTFTGNVRGYWFTAPSAFTMSALYVPTEASAGNQSIAVVRFTGATPPPAFPGTTNAFTTLFLTQNNPVGTPIPVNIPINAGDVIGIMGYRATINSYGPAGPSTTIINGAPVTLTRMGMQFPLTTTAPQQIWQEPAGAISRIFFDYILPVPQCTSPARNITVTVNQPVSVTTQPVSRTICTDKVATFTVAGTGSGTLTYQWQVSTNSGNTWANIANGGVYAGATSATLTITGPPVTMSGYYYRCVITGAAPCPGVNSGFAVLTVNPLPTVVITAPLLSLYPGLTTTITSTVSPVAAATYTWFRNGTAVSGAGTGTLNVNVDGLGTYWLTVTDVNGCTNTSNSITIKDSATATCYIYPNPNSGLFQVRYHSVSNNVLPRTLTVYDSKGDRVLTQRYTIGRPYDRMDVDMRRNGKGLYWVEIGDVNGNRLTMCRIVIQ